MFPEALVKTTVKKKKKKKLFSFENFEHKQITWATVFFPPIFVMLKQLMSLQQHWVCINNDFFVCFFWVNCSFKYPMQAYFRPQDNYLWFFHPAYLDPNITWWRCRLIWQYIMWTLHRHTTFCIWRRIGLGPILKDIRPPGTMQLLQMSSAIFQLFCATESAL